MDRRELFSLEEARDALNARFIGPTLSRMVAGVSIDTRTIAHDDLFVALPGENSDGHRFLGTAFEGGAVAAIVKEDYWEDLDRPVREIGSFLIVRDPLTALQTLASWYLNRFPELMRIGITGSNGKTTTKEFAAAVLKRHGSTYVSQGNFNSEIGLPLAIFGLQREHRFGVFELATNRVGEIALEAAILKPQIALITNIGTAHIGMFGSREAIADEKSAIFNNFDASSRGLVWEDDPFAKRLMQGKRGRFSFFGPRTTDGVETLVETGAEGGLIRYRGRDVRCKLPGRHNLLNACAAISIAQLCGAGEEAVAAGIEAVEASFGRSELLEGEVTVYQDCYNANLESLLAGIEAVRSLSWSRGRRIGVFASMKELGDEGESLHREAGRQCAASGFDAWFFLGQEARESLAAFEAEGGEGRWYPELAALGDALLAYIQPGDLLYLKGSRSMGLERLTERVREVQKGSEVC